MNFKEILCILSSLIFLIEILMFENGKIQRQHLGKEIFRVLDLFCWIFHYNDRDTIYIATFNILISLESVIL